MAKKAAAKKATKRAALKTQKTKASVAQFIAGVGDEQQRRDAKAIDRMCREISGERPAMWGPSIIGYGTYEYGTTTGRADMPKLAFSPRRGATVLYLVPELLASDPLMKKLGKHKHGKTCLYIGRLADVDRSVLRELAQRSWERMTEKYG